MGRLWHTLLLTKWKDFFAWVPIESLIHDNQQDYYQAIEKANVSDTINPFVTFMLDMIYQALAEVRDSQKNVGNNVGNNDKRIINILKKNPTYSAALIAKEIGLSSRQVERIIRRLREEK